MTKEEVRFKCLELAVGKNHNHKEAISRAEDYVAFCESKPLPSKSESEQPKNSTVDKAQAPT